MKIGIPMHYRGTTIFKSRVFQVTRFFKFSKAQHCPTTRELWLPSRSREHKISTIAFSFMHFAVLAVSKWPVVSTFSSLKFLKSWIFQVMDFQSAFRHCRFSRKMTGDFSRTSGLWVSWAVGLFRLVVVVYGGCCCGRDRDSCGR